MSNPSEPTFNVFQIEAARRRVGGVEQILKDFATIFLEDHGEIYQKLKTAIDDGDSTNIRYQAHALKGLASNFGAEDCVGCARQLEDFGRASEPDIAQQNDAVMEIRDSLERELATLKNELLMYLNR